MIDSNGVLFICGHCEHFPWEGRAKGRGKGERVGEKGGVGSRSMYAQRQSILGFPFGADDDDDDDDDDADLCWVGGERHMDEVVVVMVVIGKVRRH